MNDSFIIYNKTKLPKLLLMYNDQQKNIMQHPKHTNHLVNEELKNLAPTKVI